MICARKSCNFNEYPSPYLQFYSDFIRILLESYSNKYFYVKSFTSLYEIFRKFMWNLLQVKKIYVPLHRFWKSPDGGIGRRAGLKHQCRKASRFEPGSGYHKFLANRWFTRDFSFSICTKSVLCNKTMRKVCFYSFSLLSFIFN